MIKRLLAPVLVATLFMASCGRKEPPASFNSDYPETKTVDQVDNYFGVEVSDPYRWMEEEGTADLSAWIAAQNETTQAYLGNIPFRAALREKIEAIYNYPKYSSPRKKGDYYFYYKNDGLQNQSVIYYQKGLEGEPEVFIDPNALSAEGTLRIRLLGFSEDNRFVTVSRQEAGSDWQELRVYEIASKKELEDRIRWVKFTGAAWHGEGFYYSGYPEPEPGEELTAVNTNHRIYYHRMGDPQEKDRLVYADSENPYRYMWVEVSEDRHYLFLSVSEGTHGNELYLKDLTVEESPFQKVVGGFDYDTHPITNDGSRIILQTNYMAPNYRVVWVDASQPDWEHWTDLIGEQEDSLQGVATANRYLFCEYLKDASSRVHQYSLKGEHIREIELPALGSAYGFAGERSDEEVFYTFTSFTYPPTIYRYHIPSGASVIFRRSEARCNPEAYLVEQIFYSSKDGTRIPMFIVRGRDVKLTGDNPTLLYGYGGFNASMTPYFSATRVLLLEHGFIYAQPNIRGGAEYGEKWHRDGMLLKKQNVFDDFIAAAETLIEKKYTSSDKLAIAGASNGGLLVGACMTQRPELFRVALPAVGVMDMLRYHKFTVGWGWAVEYGSSDKEEHFHNLYSYSPLHNIKEGVSYPATLVTTADHDDRVVPAHSFKFIATLQEKHAGTNPVLIRIETKSGHGSSSTSKYIDETADEYAFMFWNLGVEMR